MVPATSWTRKSLVVSGCAAEVLRLQLRGHPSVSEKRRNVASFHLLIALAGKSRATGSNIKLCWIRSI